MSEFLREARALIASGWCQGSLARRKWGRGYRQVSPYAANAVQWCAAGALEALHARLECEEPSAAATYLTAHIPAAFPYGLDLWNDLSGRTQDEVLALYDRAIAHAEGEEAQEVLPL